MFADVVFPLPFRNSFSYKIPDELLDEVQAGVRVVAPFGKRVLTGFVIGLTEKPQIEDKTKQIKEVLDKIPIFDDKLLKFYNWISDYYFSSLGEALKYCVPLGLAVETKRRIISDPEYCQKILLEEKEGSLKHQILSVLVTSPVCSMAYLQKLMKKKNIYASLRSLEKSGIVTILDEVEDAQVNIKTLKFVKLKIQRDELELLIPTLEKKSPKQVAILLYLLTMKTEDVQLADLLKITKSSAASVESLHEKEIIEVFDKEVERKFTDNFFEESRTIILTAEQKNVIETVSKDINESKFNVFLLHGITGSGKTQVYIEQAKTALAQNKGVLILVPEISLTPQMTARLLNAFGENVSVIHSKMSKGERFDSWRKILAGQSKIVVGARSALFSPIKNLGLIVVDEEHDQSYKQNDVTPKYHARDAAIILAQINSCPIVLGSATPSVETMYNAQMGKYKLLELTERIDGAKLPEIKLVNITVEKKKNRMENIFSKTLLDEIKKRVANKEGVIVLQNRRGFATQVYCDECGEIEICENCSVPMVLHLNSNILKCHYCGATKKSPRGCTNCGSINIKFFGTGTQRVEDELDFYFPDIKIERVDSDSIDKKGKLSEILNSFRKQEIDVLIGTQIVSKGLDFPHVTLVCVISAEASLWMPDFRADERTFQLLTQVSGRAGRSGRKGEVLIQTQDDKHFILQKVLENDYHGFYNREISLRQNLGYPPFTRICLIETKDEKEENSSGAINDFNKIIRKFNAGMIITPPAEAIISKLKGFYRHQMLIKISKKIDPGGAILRKVLLDSLIEFNQKSRFRNVRLIFDIDPQNIM